MTRANKHETVPSSNGDESLTQQTFKESVFANPLLLFQSREN
jgi:hypothetical protein